MILGIEFLNTSSSRQRDDDACTAAGHAPRCSSAATPGLTPYGVGSATSSGASPRGAPARGHDWLGYGFNLDAQFRRRHAAELDHARRDIRGIVGKNRETDHFSPSALGEAVVYTTPDTQEFLERNDAWSR